MARAFVTSENDQIAERVTYEVFVKGANILGYGDELRRNSLTYQFECSHSPCISPNTEILITVREEKSHVEVKALEYVSPWA